MKKNETLTTFDRDYARTVAYREHLQSLPGYAEAEAEFRRDYAIAVEMDKARKAAKLTQKQIAERMGTTQGAVSRLMTGKNVSVNSLHRFFNACGAELVISSRRIS